MLIPPDIWSINVRHLWFPWPWAALASAASGHVGCRACCQGGVWRSPDADFHGLLSVKFFCFNIFLSSWGWCVFRIHEGTKPYKTYGTPGYQDLDRPIAMLKRSGSLRWPASGPRWSVGERKGMMPDPDDAGGFYMENMDHGRCCVLRKFLVPAGRV